MLRVVFTGVKSPKKRGTNMFYGGPTLKRRLPKAWRVVVGINEAALRPGFKRKLDAEMAKAAMERAGLDSVETIVAAGWKQVERTMIEGLQW